MRLRSALSLLVALTYLAPRSDGRIIVLFSADPAAGGRITSMMAGAGEGC